MIGKGVTDCRPVGEERSNEDIQAVWTRDAGRIEEIRGKAICALTAARLNMLHLNAIDLVDRF
jgi:hypothetical protein